MKSKISNSDNKLAGEGHKCAKPNYPLVPALLYEFKCILINILLALGVVN